jgi:hypothetical protein
MGTFDGTLQSDNSALVKVALSVLRSLVHWIDTRFFFATSLIMYLVSSCS